MTFSNAIDWLRRDGPRWENLGITLSAGTFSVTQANGSALSTSDAAYVTIPDRANPGRQRVFRVIANQSFTDSSGSNQIGNNLFGLTTAVAYAADVPFYIYAAADSTDANLTFFISRIPHRTICPLAASIAQSGNTNASTQGGFFALQAITAANFDSQPCICIGAFRMRYTGSSWTVQTLTDGSVASNQSNLQADGIGCFHEGTKFLMTTGQFGAATGSFFLNNGGTAPAWSSQAQAFTIERNGSLQIVMSAATSTAGAGAVLATLALPFISLSQPTYGNAVYTGAFGILWDGVGSNSSATIVATTGAALINSTNANLAVASYKHQLAYIVSAS